MKTENIVEILNELPENIPLYKDSGLWQFRTDDMEDVICYQGVNESFEDFVIRYRKENPLTIPTF